MKILAAGVITSLVLFAAPNGEARADEPDSIVFGAGAGLGVPGFGRVEGFVRVTDASFLPKVFMELSAIKTYGWGELDGLGDDQNSDMVFAGTTTLVARGGLVTRSGAKRRRFISDGGRVGQDMYTGTSQNVKGVRTFGFVGGLMSESLEWQPDASAPASDPLESGTTVTAMGGIHSFWQAGRSDAMSSGHDLSVTYGLNGPRKGLGALYTFTYAQYGFLYGTLDLGGVFLGGQDNVPWYGLLRVGATFGLRFGLAK